MFGYVNINRNELSDENKKDLPGLLLRTLSETKGGFHRKSTRCF